MSTFARWSPRPKGDPGLKPARNLANVGLDHAARTTLAADTLISCSKYTFVTIVFEAEYPLLLVQAHSMQLYCPLELTEAIIVIHNSKRALPRRWKERFMAAYGQLANYVRFVSAKEIVQLPHRIGGYWAQQFLKLKASSIIKSDRYVILDAKTHLVFPLTRAFLEAPDGRARIYVHAYSDPMLSHLKWVLAYLGVDSTSYAHSFTTCVAPFIVYTDIVRRLISDLEKKETTSFEQLFIARKLWEFFLYTGYIVQQGIKLEDLYYQHQVWCAGIWKDYTDKEIDSEVAYAAANQTLTPFFSLHRRAIARLGAHSRRTIANFWCSRMLFRSTNSAVSFLVIFQIKLISGSLRRRFVSLLLRYTPLSSIGQRE